MDSEGAKSPQLLIDLVLGYRAAKAIFVAHRLGLFEALETGPQSAAELARKVGADERACTVLLRGAVAVGLLTHEQGRFSNSAVASAQLIAGRPGYVGHNLTYKSIGILNALFC